MKTIAILGGAGHVGLPLGLVFAKQENLVYAIDIDASKIHSLSGGNLPFKEEGGKQILEECLRSNKFHPVTDEDCITLVQYVIVTLATDLNEFNEPNQIDLLNVISNLVEKMHSGQTLILRSTLLPGSMQKIYEIIKNSQKEILLGYCPERIQEGKALEEIVKLPQIIGTADLESFNSCKDLFETLGVNCLKSNFMEAEIAKLFSNVWRYLNFTIANNFYSICLERNLSYSKIRDLITQDYPRAKNLPKPQLTGGPCLPKDTVHLDFYLNNKFELGQLALKINSQLCNTIISDLEKKYKLSDLNVGVLGMSFKPDSDDSRTSLSYLLRDLLKTKCKKLLTADDQLSDSELVSESFLIENVDLIVISTPHSRYLSLNSTNKIYNPWLL